MANIDVTMKDAQAAAQVEAQDPQGRDSEGLVRSKEPRSLAFYGAEPAYFHGKPDEDAGAMLYAFKLAKHPGWSKRDEFIMLASRLKGDALNLWVAEVNNLERAGKEPGLEELTTFLKGMFIPDHTPVTIRAELASGKHKQRVAKDETVQHFNVRFLSVMSRVPDMTEAEKMQYYLVNVQPESARRLAEGVGSGHFQSVREMAEHCQRIDSYQRATERASLFGVAERFQAQPRSDVRTGGKKRANEGKGSAAGSSKKLKGHSSAPTDGVKLDSKQMEALKKAGACFRCGQSGHQAKACQKPDANGVAEKLSKLNIKSSF
jgi:hypothetical protein